MSANAPKPTRLRHVRVPLRVTVDRNEWPEQTLAELDNAVRDYCVTRLREERLVVAVRRDRS